ncbi:sensor domain-containing diguanylate cyclase [Roseofilum casamattae]|uniref:Diguanylate cyclase n=1 Tax=Roseofilum casamattae BLCC-M143 TaxID=3022442 RepID=A0ABT7BWL0_9CYAN|nr:diguanylate cyclase [Roseofilum casamattae]MDJ1183585.1 diguanylate cyclase [Roseofilum casamattae BLCC-M143]
MVKLSLKKIVCKANIKSILQAVLDRDPSLAIVDDCQTLLMGNSEIHLLESHGREIAVEDRILGWILGGHANNSNATIIAHILETELNKKVLAADALDKYEELNFLYDISAKISTCLYVDEVIKLMADEALKQIPGNMLAVVLYNANENSLQTFYPQNNRVTLGHTLSPDMGIVGAVFRSGKAEIVNQVRSDDRFIDREFSMYSLICAPLKTQQGILGAIQISSDRPMQYTAQDLKLFMALASQAAASIQNALFYKQLEEYSRTLEVKVAERTAALERANQELNRLAHLDGLTKVANRRCFEDVFQKEWYRLAEEKQPLSIIVCDVDYFKRYNDTYGHQMGDECLQAIATTIATTLTNPTDLVARYGGEEFVVIMPNAQASNAWMIAQNIEREIRQLGIEHKASLVSPLITLSMGISSIVPHNAISSQEFFEIADRALYDAKKQGRDRVVFRELKSSVI